MQQDGTIAMFRYWNSLRAGRSAPHRGEIEPAAIKANLADIFILERHAEGDARFRLAGTRFCAIFGRELRRNSFQAIWSPVDRQSADRLAEIVFLQNRVVCITFTGFTANHRTAGFELLLVPLDAQPGNPRLMGTLVPLAAPYWLGTQPIVEGRIDSLEIVDPDEEAGRAALDPPSLVPEGSGLLSDEMEPKRVRHLLVIEGGRGG